MVIFHSYVSLPEGILTFTLWFSVNGNCEICERSVRNLWEIYEKTHRHRFNLQFLQGQAALDLLLWKSDMSVPQAFQDIVSNLSTGTAAGSLLEWCCSVISTFLALVVNRLHHHLQNVQNGQPGIWKKVDFNDAKDVRCWIMLLGLCRFVFSTYMQRNTVQLKYDHSMVWDINLVASNWEKTKKTVSLMSSLQDSNHVDTPCFDDETPSFFHWLGEEMIQRVEKKQLQPGSYFFPLMEAT